MVSRVFNLLFLGRAIFPPLKTRRAFGFDLVFVSFAVSVPSMEIITQSPDDRARGSNIKCKGQKPHRERLS